MVPGSDILPHSQPKRIAVFLIRKNILRQKYNYRFSFDSFIEFQVDLEAAADRGHVQAACVIKSDKEFGECIFRSVIFEALPLPKPNESAQRTQHLCSNK